MTKHQVETGGKLYIAGEYSILYPGQTAILKNIPIKMTAVIEDSDAIKLTSDMFDYSTDMTDDNNYQLIQESIKTFAHFIKQSPEKLPPFSLSITGKLEKEGKKFGIGSSGSVTVLTIKALAAFFQVSIDPDIIFKLASYTLLKLGDNGSMGDIACIAYDVMVAYTSFDRQIMASHIHSKPIEEVISLDWGYRIVPIKPNLDITILVGWTKVPAISKDMINRVKAKISPQFLKQTQTEVIQCQKALVEGDKESFMSSLQAISQLLFELDPIIYHPKLIDLCQALEDIDGIAKSSGSGGGDCGIAFTFSDVDTNLVNSRWKELDIETIYQEKWSSHGKS